MKILSSTATSTKDLFKILLNDGVVVLPSDLGYGILCLTPKGMDKLYTLKNRPRNKPTGVVGTPEIFNEITISEFRHSVKKFSLPVGLIEKCNPESSYVSDLPDLIRPDGTIAVFMNLNQEMDKLARLAFEEGYLIIISSANKAGEGNVYELEDLHSDFKEQADFFLPGTGTSKFKLNRGRYENITTTIVDLTSRSLMRDGVYESRVYEQARRLGMIVEEGIQTAAKETTLFRSCIFLQSFKPSVYERIPAIINADWIAIDLQDGCPANKKQLARELLESHLRKGTFKGKNVFVRINDLESRKELEKDLLVEYTDQITGFATPMINNEDDLLEYESLIGDLENRLGLPYNTFKLFPIVETAESLINAEAIGKASERNLALLLGHADLFGDTHSVRDSQNLHYVRFRYLLAARAAGLRVFDTPYENVKEFDKFIDDCIEGRKIGLDGKVALHFDQIEDINRIFGIDPTDSSSLNTVLKNYKGGCYLKDGKFIAPPILRQIKNELDRGEYHPEPNYVKGIKGQKFNYGLDYENAYIGQIIVSPYEITIDESWIMSWHSLIPSFNPIETSSVYCKSLGLDDRLLPYQALVNLALCMIVECYSESCLYHLGIQDVEYERPAHPGDTLKSVMIVDDIKNTSSGKYSVVKSRVLLLNQFNNTIMSMHRSSLFPYIVGLEDRPGRQSDDKPKYRQLFRLLPDTLLKDTILNHSVTMRSELLDFQHEIAEEDLILHGLTRPVGLSASVLYSTLCKNTHPLHFNNARYGEDKLVVSGGFILPIVIGAASRDLKHSLHETILDTMHVDKVSHKDSIGAMSYILDKKVKGGGIEELTIRSFGLRNIDVENDLEGVTIPYELLLSDDIKPSEIAELCQLNCPKLIKKIVLRVTWKMWRKMKY
ncbi:MAG: aldolase/citrate lyase family protein [Bacteroidota bacterium]